MCLERINRATFVAIGWIFGMGDYRRSLDNNFDEVPSGYICLGCRIEVVHADVKILFIKK